MNAIWTKIITAITGLVPRRETGEVSYVILTSLVILTLGGVLTFGIYAYRPTPAENSVAAAEASHVARRPLLEDHIKTFRAFVMKTCPQDVGILDDFADKILKDFDARTLAYGRRDVQEADRISENYRSTFEKMKERLSNTRSPSLYFIQQLLNKLLRNESTLDELVAELNKEF